MLSPNSGKSKTDSDRPNTRSVTISPSVVSLVATRKKVSSPSIRFENWPSCGRRRSAIFMFAILGMGLVVGVFMRTQSAALALSFLLIFFPGFFLTGIFFPIVSMPEIMRMESLAMPGTHYGIITRGVFLTGVGIEVLWPYAVMLFGLGVGFSFVAGLFFKKKLD